MALPLAPSPLLLARQPAVDVLGEMGDAEFNTRADDYVARGRDTGMAKRSRRTPYLTSAPAAKDIVL